MPGFGQRVPQAVPAGQVGQLATRSLLMTAQTQLYTTTQQMSRVMHFARSPITTAQCVFPNWYVGIYFVNNAYMEFPTGGTATITGSIEYPQGTIAAQLTFSGSASGTILSGGQLISDPFTVNIPQGAQFWERTYWTNSVGSILCERGSNTFCGDIGISGNSGVADQTMSPVVTGAPADPQQMYCASAIIGLTPNRSFALIGDSRTAGGGAPNPNNDKLDASGDVGTTTRSVGANFSYLMLARSASQAVEYVNSNALRTALINSYCTDVIVDYGVNDINEGQSTAQLEASLTSIANLYPTKRVYATTINLSNTDNSDAWQTLSAQTGNSSWFATNTWLLGGTSPFRAVYDVATFSSAPSDHSRWNVNGTPYWYTGDGTHESQTLNLLIQSNGIIPANPL